MPSSIPTLNSDPQRVRPVGFPARLWQPAIAYAVLVIACLWAVVPSPALDVAGHVLGEHWYSLYNFMLAAAALLLFLRARLARDPGVAWRVFDLALCGALVTGIGKLGFPHLDRPSGGEHGFPSGHALTAFAASWLLMETFPNVSPYAFVIAVAVGWSRVEIHEHYTYQVLIGAPLGMLVGYAVSRAPDGVGVLLPRLYILIRVFIGYIRRCWKPKQEQVGATSQEGVWPPPPRDDTSE